MLDYYDHDADSEHRLELGDELIPDNGDPLATRLRTMTWTSAPAEVRERCWLEIKRHVESLGHERARCPEPSPDVNCDRYLYSRRREPHSTAPEPRRSLSAPVRHFRPRTLAWAFR